MKAAIEIRKLTPRGRKGVTIVTNRTATKKSRRPCQHPARKAQVTLSTGRWAKDRMELFVVVMD
jgi:hypothetical protein